MQGVFEFKMAEYSLDNDDAVSIETDGEDEQRSLMSDGYAFFDDESVLSDDGYNGTWSCKKSS